MTMREAERIERETHKAFEALSRAPLGSVGSEWFTATPELIAHVEREGISVAECAMNLPGAEAIMRLFVEN